MSVYIININWDCHAGAWCAINNDIPLALECDSFDELLMRVKAAVPEILNLNGAAPSCMLHFVAERREVVL